jgi:hypothetical protein
MAAGCPFITCAIKKMGVGFCWDCGKNGSCEKWTSHREAGKVRDSFKCYQKLEDDIDFIKKHGVQAFDEQQKTRESLLTALLDRFNEGRSKSYYCIAATVFDTYELSNALEEGVSTSKSMGIKDKSRNMHAILERIALKKGYVLSLRK